MTNERISEIRARCEAATPGPWKATFGMDCRAFIKTPNEDSDFKLYNHADAAFIAHAREDIPFLLAEIDSLTEAQRWIPVSERLPEIDVAVIVRHIYQRDEYSPVTMGRLYQPCDKRRKPYWTFVSIRASDGMVYNDGTDFICPGSEFVTHWMPLPAPPEEGAEHE